jgi:hypothetical protein
MGYKHGTDVLYNLHEANQYIMKAALEIYNSKKKEGSTQVRKEGIQESK